MAERKHQGLVQIFTGAGKGKTTAALGTVVRASGQGLRVLVVFFMKGQYSYGEYSTLTMLPNVEIASFGLRKLIRGGEPKEGEVEQAALALTRAREAMLSGKYDIIVLDEINVALWYKLVELDQVIRLLEDRPPAVELILTGRYAAPELVERADLVTEMVKQKHPFDAGIRARRGIEY